jgi:hypothetical protein
MKYKLDDEVTIRVLTAPYFLATKFSAFHDRGNDPRTSSDFEDIVYVLDSRLNIVDEIRSAPNDVGNYLREQLKVFLNEDMNESISCHLSPFQSEERLSLLREKVRSILRDDAS